MSVSPFDGDSQRVECCVRFGTALAVGLSLQRTAEVARWARTGALVVQKLNDREGAVVSDVPI